MVRTKRRQRCSPEEIAETLADYHRSGLTQKAFAQQRGIPLPTLSSWLRRAREKLLRQPPFLAVQPVDELSPSRSVSNSTTMVELVAPNGWRIALSLSPGQLDQLLTTVSNQPIPPCSR